jgi:predicted metal-dependent hydrolase
VLRKPIRHLRLGVYPPHGLVRVAAPLGVSDDAIQRLVVSRLDWIRRHQARFEGQSGQSGREVISGESHYFLGQPYVLRVVEQRGPARVALQGVASIDLYIRPAASVEDRRRVLHNWYRQELKALIPPLLARWQPVVGVEAAEWGVRTMRTRWGSCNIRARRIWLSLELARKPAECLEYVVVHELVHLLERRHNQRFYGYLDRFMPTWRLARAALTGVPVNPALLGHAVENGGLRGE